MYWNCCGTSELSRNGEAFYNNGFFFFLRAIVAWENGDDGKCSPQWNDLGHFGELNWCSPTRQSTIKSQQPWHSNLAKLGLWKCKRMEIKVVSMASLWQLQRVKRLCLMSFMHGQLASTTSLQLLFLSDTKMASTRLFMAEWKDILNFTFWDTSGDWSYCCT